MVTSNVEQVHSSGVFTVSSSSPSSASDASSSPLSPPSSSPLPNVRSSSDAGLPSTTLPLHPPPLPHAQSAPPSTHLPLPSPTTPTSSPTSNTTSPISSPCLSTRRPKLVDGLLHSSCHQCKTTKVHHLVLSCRAQADPLRKQRQCRKKYCSTCLLRTYGLNLQAMTKKELDEWVCPSCHDACCCAACKRTKEKAYVEQMTKLTTQAVVHQPAVVGTMAQGQGEMFRVKSLSDAMMTSGGAPVSEGDDGGQLHAQLAHLQQIHQMQQLQQTLQLIQALSNNSQQQQQQQQQQATQPSFGLTEQLPVPATNSPAQRQMKVDPTSTPNLIPLRSDSHDSSKGVDETFGHALHLRIAALRQSQQQDRAQVEPVNSLLPPVSTSIPSTACSTPNEMTQPLSSLSFPRSMSHPESIPTTPSAPVDEGDFDYGAIATKLMTAASLATRIFQEQQSGKHQHLYQQQCRLQQAHEALQHHQQLQHQHTQVVPLSASSLSSSVGAHQAFLSRMEGPPHQGALPLAPSLQPQPSSGARSFSSASGGSSHSSTAPINDMMYNTSLTERDAIHQLQMNILQDQQRVQLQHLLDTQERIRQHSANDTDRSQPHDSFQPDPPTKRQCHLQPSDAMHQLQMKVAALQVEQRRLAMQEADEQRRGGGMEDGYSRAECGGVELSPMNFLSSEGWEKYNGQGEQSGEPQVGWPLEVVDEEDEARMMRRVI